MANFARLRLCQKICACIGVPLLILALTSIAVASPSDPATITAVAQPSAVHMGEISELVLTAKIDPGWHLYGLKPVPPPAPSTTEISVSGNGIAAAGAATEDKPVTAYDANFEKQVTYHLKHASFSVPVKITAAALGPVNCQVSINYQTCNDKFCLPPRTKEINVALTVTPGAVRQQYSHAAAPLEDDSDLPLFLAAAFGAGLLSLLTPCVFPLIPITLSSFVKQADGNKRRLVLISSSYSIGIIALYVAVGFLTAIVLGASGISRLATNPWVNLFAFAVFLVFALSFFETIRIELPVNLGSLQNGAKKQGGWLSLAALGTVVGTLLVTAAGGSFLRPLLGMLVFSIAFVSPFLLFSMFPQWISRVPKSGVWLARVKATLGFIELAASLKFLSNVDLVWQWKILTEPVLLAAWALIFLCTALYLVGLLRFGIVADTEAAGSRVSIGRWLFAGAFTLSALYCFWGLSGRAINPYIAAYLPPAGYGGKDGVSSDSGLQWMSDYDTAIAASKAQGKPLLIDFTGYTCTNCRLNEKQVFPAAKVQRALSKFVLVQLYTDGGKDAAKNENLEISKFGDAALPLYGIVDPGSGTELAKTAGVQTIDGFTSFLQRSTSPTSVSQAEWQTYTNPALSQSISRQHPAIIDFTASWCTNCKAIERTVFTDPVVRDRLTSYDTYRCDMTNFSLPANVALQKKYGIVSLPAIVFLDKNGREIPGTRISSLITTSGFEAVLDRAKLGS
jgi:thiol:disulfide interchange protein DsbD